jgi:ethanolaminephosphotransferase
MPVISPAGLVALRSYQYRGEDRSLLFKWLLSPLAEACVAYLTPRSMACVTARRAPRRTRPRAPPPPSRLPSPPPRCSPNTITLLGLLLQMLAYALMLPYSGDFAAAPPRALIALAAAALFAYSTLDNMDGKQVRPRAAAPRSARQRARRRATPLLAAPPRPLPLRAGPPHRRLVAAGAAL